MENELANVSAGAIMPQSFDAKYRMAKVLSMSGLVPQGLNTPEKVCVALQWGHELGLSPMVSVNNIAVINGKPTLSADIMAAVVKRCPEYGGIEWIELSDKKAECKITRILSNGVKETIVSSFTIEDAHKAGLDGREVWRKYPKRMLKHRCLSYGFKDLFPDLLAGLYDPEEIESINVVDEPPKERNVTPVSEPKQEPIVTAEKSVEETSNGTSNAVQESSSKEEIYMSLEHILDEYGMDLRAKNATVQPYTLAKNCLDNPQSTESDLKAMYDRCIAFLNRKGIKVA